MFSFPRQFANLKGLHCLAVESKKYLTSALMHCSEFHTLWHKAASEGFGKKTENKSWVLLDVSLSPTFLQAPKFINEDVCVKGVWMGACGYNYDLSIQMPTICPGIPKSLSESITPR